MFTKITRDIESYIEYLREDGVTEIVSFSHRQQMENGQKRTGDNGALAPEAGLKKIADAVATCTKCPLHQKRNRTVPGQGNPEPEILFIGEGPGEEEDQQGLAFVGRAGQLLTRLITRMGFTREQVFIANIVKCRPPNNRKPLPEEMQACLPYLEEQIAVLKPKVIILLGACAFEALFPPALPGRTISKVRGKWLEYHATGRGFAEGYAQASRSAVADKGIPTMPTFHPSYLLRNQSAMWDVWNDMQQVLKHLGRPVPARGVGKPSS